MSSGFQNFDVGFDPESLQAEIQKRIEGAVAAIEFLASRPPRFMAERLGELGDAVDRPLQRVAQTLADRTDAAGRTVDDLLSRVAQTVLLKLESPVGQLLKMEDQLRQAQLADALPFDPANCADPVFRELFPSLCEDLPAEPPPGGSVCGPDIPPELCDPAGQPPGSQPPQPPTPPPQPPQQPPQPPQEPPAPPPGQPPSQPPQPPQQPPQPPSQPPQQPPQPPPPSQPPQQPPSQPPGGGGSVPTPGPQPPQQPPEIPEQPPPPDPTDPGVPMCPPGFAFNPTTGQCDPEFPPEPELPPPGTTYPIPPEGCAPGTNVVDADGNPVADPSQGESCQVPPESSCPRCGCVTCQCGAGAPPIPEAERGFVVWQQPGGLCYVTKAADPPRGITDVALSRGATVAEATAGAQGCTLPTEAPPPGEAPTETPQLSTGAECELDEFETPEGSTGDPAGTATIESALKQILYGSEQGFRLALAQAADAQGSINPAELFAALLKGGAARFIEVIGKGLDQLASDAGCITATTLKSAAVLSGLDLLSYVSPTVAAQIGQRDRYILQQRCPVLYPTAAEARAAFIGGEIDERIARIWIEQNNQCWTPYEKTIDAQRRRLEPLTAQAMWLRQIIDDEQFDEEFKRMGWRIDDPADKFRELAKFVPPISDLVRFMVRDVENTTLVREFGMDDQFDENWQGFSREAGAKQGIDDETAKRYWRAHWSLPAPTQLFNMFHRSRARKFEGENITTLAQVEAALRQQDVLPFWIPRLIETTFSRLSRVDIRRAFNLGAIDEATMRGEFTKIGYDDTGVNALVAFAKRQRLEASRNVKEVQLYRRMLIPRLEAERRLAQRNLPPPEVQEILKDAELESTAGMQRRCINAVRKRFLSGELNPAEALDALSAAGVPGEFLPRIVRTFECERSAKGKQASTTQLCEWLDLGSILPEEFVRRLINVGWTENDAFRILEQCLSKINQRQRRQAEQQARQQAAEIRRQQREAERLRKAAERERNTAQRNLEKARRAKDRREKVLQKAAQKWVEVAPITHETARDVVSGLFDELSKAFLITADEVAQTIVLAIERGKPPTPEDLRVLARELAETLEQLDELPPDLGNVALRGGGDNGRQREG